MENNSQPSKASGQQAAASKQKRSSKAPESEGFDKKLDGPNRPST
ncbi:spore protein [Paenibacillus sp. R14(2021)]|nr:spore protein [Paenibacillus sp. R14(2021)]